MALVLADQFSSIAWNDVQKAYEIKRVLPMDNQKSCRLAIQVQILA